jgi:hypothetical protein
VIDDAAAPGAAPDAALAAVRDMQLRAPATQSADSVDFMMSLSVAR